MGKGQGGGPRVQGLDHLMHSNKILHLGKGDGLGLEHGVVQAFAPDKVFRYRGKGPGANRGRGWGHRGGPCLCLGHGRPLGRASGGCFGGLG